MGLIEALGGGPVALDTCIFIYLIEGDARWRGPVTELFRAVDAGRLPAVTSGLTLLETLVVPYRANDEALARRYETLLRNSRGLTLVDLDAELLRDAARLRARHRIRTPDAIQLAAARLAGCTCLLTNDRDLPDVAGVRVLQLAALG